MSVFDLTETQADYILDMPLRRLTKFSRIELEKEQSELRAHDRGARRDPRPTTQLLRKVVSDELAEVAKTFGTPRRTVLLESPGRPSPRPVPLEVADDPCLSTCPRPACWPAQRRRAARRRGGARPSTT
jgi:DNA gyrase subunit A